MMLSQYRQGFMEKNTDRGYEKTKPKQTQSNPIPPILLYTADGASFIGDFKFILGTVVEISGETIS